MPGTHWSMPGNIRHCRGRNAAVITYMPTPDSLLDIQHSWIVYCEMVVVIHAPNSGTHLKQHGYTSIYLYVRLTQVYSQCIIRLVWTSSYNLYKGYVASFLYRLDEQYWKGWCCWDRHVVFMFPPRLELLGSFCFPDFQTFHSTKRTNPGRQIGTKQ